jgi:non-heme Fe2+,alpha-ketoglutarate-dependent halogenase
VERELPEGLSAQQLLLHYQQRGYFFPIRVLSDAEVSGFRGHYQDFIARNSERLRALPPREQHVVLSMTHSAFDWVYQMVSHPTVLDAVEGILGPDLLVWDSRWFSKMPGDKAYVAWHQDALYWGLRPPQVTTAWIALSDSTSENGGMQVIPGSHQGNLLGDKQTYAPDNALASGQEIAVEVDEADAVDIVLRPGEMSLHHAGIIHGSKANTSDKPRIGIAVRYISPDVVQAGTVRQLALLVRGRDDFGHFDLVDPPKDNLDSAGMQGEALRRILTNVLPQKSQSPL